MSDTTELLEAAKAVLPYLRASTDKHGFPTLEESVAKLDRSAGDQLRLDASAADAKDAAILRFRKAVEAAA